MKIIITILLLSCWAEAQKLYGIHDDKIPQHISLIQQVGAKVVRVPVSWNDMEPDEKGKIAPGFWLSIDSILSATEGSKMLTIIVFSQTPCWASSDPRKQCGNPSNTIFMRYPPASPNDYADAVAALVYHYRGRLLGIELWDEPNLIWPPFGPRQDKINDNSSLFVDLQGAERYTNLVKAAYPKIKKADPNITVVAGSIAAADLDYINVMYDNGIKGSFDALSIHPFTDVFPVDADNVRYGISYSPIDCPKGASLMWCFRDGVERIRRAMLLREDRKPIWFTQFGFRSTVVGNWARTTGHELYLRMAFQLINGWDFVRVACWSNLIDTTESNTHETRFGLFDSFLNMKPVGERFREQVSQSFRTPPSAQATTRRRD